MTCPIISPILLWTIYTLIYQTVWAAVIGGCMVYGKEDAYDASWEPTNEKLDFEHAKNKTNQEEGARERYIRTSPALQRTWQ